MTTYREIRETAKEFLMENPEVEAVTIRRQIDPPRQVFDSPNSESYHLMPESCPIVREVLHEHLTSGETITEDLIERIFSSLHDRVTDPFRDALTSALTDKHRALRELRGLRKKIDEIIPRIETERPETNRKPRREREIIVAGLDNVEEVSLEEEDV